MALKVVNAGELILLALLRTPYLTGSSLNYRLFKNNYTPVDDSVLADFTEADYQGYAFLTPALWSIVALVGGRAFTQAEPLVYLCTGGATPNTIYGYYATDVVSGNVVLAERFVPGPIAMAIAGDTLTINPSLALSTES